MHVLDFYRQAETCVERGGGWVLLVAEPMTFKQSEVPVQNSLKCKIFRLVVNKMS